MEMNKLLSDYVKKELGDIQSLSPKELEYLSKVADVLQESLSEANLKYQDILGCKHDMSSIANSIGVSRPTVYKPAIKGLLNYYLELFPLQQNKREVTRLREELDEANKRIQGFLLKEYSVQYYKHQINEITKKYEEDETTIKSLEEQIYKLKEENKELKQKTFSTAYNPAYQIGHNIMTFEKNTKDKKNKS